MSPPAPNLPRASPAGAQGPWAPTTQPLSAARAARPLPPAGRRGPDPCRPQHTRPPHLHITTAVMSEGSTTHPWGHNPDRHYLLQGVKLTTMSQANASAQRCCPCPEHCPLFPFTHRCCCHVGLTAPAAAAAPSHLAAAQQAVTSLATAP